MTNAFAKFRQKIVDVKPNEWHAMWLAFVFNFVVLAGYYVLRPIRDEIGATSGVENLPWMYTFTLLGMIVANALFAAIVARMSRRRFIPIAYRFAIANLFIFFLLMRFVSPQWQWLLVARVFCLGQRFQSFRDHTFLGVHDRSFHFRTGQAPFRFHRGWRFVRRNCRAARPHSTR